jgi:hypothetical protein
MKVKILVASALLDDDRTGSLYQTVDVSDERGEYLVSIGAAEAVSEPEQADESEPESEAEQTPPPAPAEVKKAAPSRKPAPRTK